MHNYEHRQFVIFDVSEISAIDFTQVLETSADTVRTSVDGTKTFVKWDTETVPSCVETLTTKSIYYTYEEILTILATPEWSDISEMI
jgi:hypothetical protein